jgi:hypothetical protein
MERWPCKQNCTRKAIFSQGGEDYSFETRESTHVVE